MSAQPTEPETKVADADQDVIETAEETGDVIAGLSEEKPSGNVIELRSRSGAGILTIDPNQTKWTPAQVTGLRSIGVETVGDDAVPFSYVWQFLHMCQKSDLDPWMREAYLITHGKRFVKDSGEVVDNRKFTLVTGIDGFRKKAEDTGEYVGQVGPEWLTSEGRWVDFWLPKWGKPEAARVGILRKGFDLPVYGVAVYSEFEPVMDEYAEVETQGQYGPYMKRQKTGKKVPTAMWEKMPSNQIAKCAEAQGFRKTFPRQMAGMYEAAEMQRAQAEYAQQQADEQERGQRDKRVAAQRAAATKAPAADGPETVAADVEVVAANLDPATDRKAALMAELTWQAEVMDASVSRLTARAKRAVKKNIEDFTDAELLAVVAPLRPTVTTRLRETERGDDADLYVALGPEDVVDVEALLTVEGEIVDDGSEDDAEADAEADTDSEDEPQNPSVDPDAEHDYVNDPTEGVCAICRDPEDRGPHPKPEAADTEEALFQEGAE